MDHSDCRPCAKDVFRFRVLGGIGDDSKRLARWAGAIEAYHDGFADMAASTTMQEFRQVGRTMKQLRNITGRVRQAFEFGRDAGLRISVHHVPILPTPPDATCSLVVRFFERGRKTALQRRQQRSERVSTYLGASGNFPVFHCNGFEQFKCRFQYGSNTVLAWPPRT